MRRRNHVKIAWHLAGLLAVQALAYFLFKQGLRVLPALLEFMTAAYFALLQGLHDKWNAELDKEFGRRINPFRSRRREPKRD